MEHAVKHAVITMRERFWEPLTLDDLAHSVMLSKYHFLRVFSRVTGVTPGRFLTAVRLQEAKRLLLSTSFNVAEVAVRVGYSSTGSFTRRFTELVGLSPTQYRKLSLGADSVAPAPLVPKACVPGPVTPSTGSVTGRLRTTGAVLETACVAAFHGAMPQGVPASWDNACAPGRFTLARVPTGTWYIHAVARGSDGDGSTDPDRTVFMATVGPVHVKDGITAHLLDFPLSPVDWTRPPILSALMGIDPQPMAA
ncbi:helix-turn-helix transcriptional regulator [Streptomyces pseudovenezuelae]|uniref:helix-turn-helix transcriptional regulator n=1 Tax=Streptomyces pseudovenezuelae TaxID=67350 RepID=UPI0034A5081D